MTQTGTIQTLEIDNTQIINRENIQTKDQTMIIITIDHVKIPRTKILIVQIDKETILSHHMGILCNIKIHKKTIEVAHPNIEDKSTKYSQLKKPNQNLPVLITQKIQNYN